MKGANNSDVSQGRLRLSRQNGGASKDAMSFHLPPPRLPGLGQTSAYAETNQPLAGIQRRHSTHCVGLNRNYRVVARPRTLGNPAKATPNPSPKKSKTSARVRRAAYFKLFSRCSVLLADVTVDASLKTHYLSNSLSQLADKKINAGPTLREVRGWPEASQEQLHYLGSNAEAQIQKRL